LQLLEERGIIKKTCGPIREGMNKSQIYKSFDERVCLIYNLRAYPVDLAFGPFFRKDKYESLALEASYDPEAGEGIDVAKEKIIDFQDKLVSNLGGFFLNRMTYSSKIIS